MDATWEQGFQYFAVYRPLNGLYRLKLEIYSKHLEEIPAHTG